MKLAPTFDPSTADDLASLLAKAVSHLPGSPRLVTFSRAPSGYLLDHVFGPRATLNLVGPVLGPDRSAGFSLPDGRPALLADLSAGDHPIVARFLEPACFGRLVSGFPHWMSATTAVVVQFPPTGDQIETLQRLGLSQFTKVAGPARAATVFSRPVQPPAPRWDPAVLSPRPPMRRLVIVDPCLGRAAGHYRRYAEMLTDGARSRGAQVVWACHAGCDIAGAPPDIVISPCFPRCFFDLDEDQAPMLDLSPEMRGGLEALMDAFDDPETHFLFHSADAHQLRAMNALLATRPAAKSAFHINFQASPRFLPGRIAGEEAHHALMRLRRAPQWERTVFLWTETSHLATWMSAWLGETIPGAPFLAAPPERLPPTDATPLTISFLGEARASKGFFDLPEIADQIAGRPELANSVRLVVQNWPAFRADAEAHRHAVARLRDHPFVEVVDGILAPDDYDRRLSASQVLLLPYDPASYALQGSGIWAEGMARGSVIVARAGTAMAANSPLGMVFSYASIGNLVEVLGDIVTRRTDIMPEAAERAAEFRRVSGPGHYVAALDARARGAARGDTF